MTRRRRHRGRRRCRQPPPPVATASVSAAAGGRRHVDHCGGGQRRGSAAWRPPRVRGGGHGRRTRRGSGASRCVAGLARASPLLPPPLVAWSHPARHAPQARGGATPKQTTRRAGVVAAWARAAAEARRQRPGGPHGGAAPASRQARFGRQCIRKWIVRHRCGGGGVLYYPLCVRRMGVPSLPYEAVEAAARGRGYGGEARGRRGTPRWIDRLARPPAVRWPRRVRAAVPRV